jgi:predicted TIM-barrel fold metal-dependent hydrolase
MLAMIKLYPERFVGTAIVDPLGPGPDAAMRALSPAGVRAFRIAPNYSKLPPGRWLEPPGYSAMFAAAARTGQALSCLINPDAFAEVDRMCTRFPDTTAIIDHLGRVGADGTIRDADVEALCALAKHPNVLVKVGAFYALGKKSPPYLDLAPMIRRMVQAFGARRCLWESDCPFQVVAHTYYRQPRPGARPPRLLEPGRPRLAAPAHRRADAIPAAWIAPSSRPSPGS